MLIAEHLGPNDRTLPPVRATRGPSGEVVLPSGSQSRASFVLCVHRAIENRRSLNVYRNEPFPRCQGIVSLRNAQFVLHARDQAEVAMGGNLDKEKPRQSSSEGKLTIRGIDGTPFR